MKQPENSNFRRSEEWEQRNSRKTLTSGGPKNGSSAANRSVAHALDEISGIVLIDEIDLHLHISYQRVVLPAIIRQFPKVQFVITTHSPFFVLGLQETGEVDVISLPIGNKIEPDEFSEFQAGYDIFIEKNAQFKARFEELTKKTAAAATPLIITEGKTDWKHLKNALHHLKSAGLYSGVDIEFFEFEDDVDMGDSKLQQMCESFAKLWQPRKLIFVFDRDVKSIIKDMSGYPNLFRSWGNRVYSFCLPVPVHRSGYEFISIEHLYRDADLRARDPATGKRLWFTNEIKIINEPGSNEKIFQAQDNPNSNSELRKKVFDQPAERITDSAGKFVGLSKAAFVSAIVENEAVAGSFDREAFKAVFDIVDQIAKQPE